ncbi:MAG: RimK/LysX family protein, partial [Cyanobium sp.]
RRTTMASLDGKIIVGSEEWCSFPDAGLPAIKARVDSGAATSALHAINILPFEREGCTWVSFEVHPLQGDRSVVVRHEAPVLAQREVRNTSGAVETRYVIRERLVLGEQSWAVELTLSNRDAMGYRMLLGRQAMVGRILVDPAGSHRLREISAEECRALYAHAQKRKDGLRIVLLASNPKLYSNRRLLLARALVHDPAVLVLDEPTNGLDLKAKHQILEILRDLARSGTTLLLVTHQIEAILPEIQRAVLLREGRVVGDGPVSDLLQDGPLSALFDTPLQVCQANGYRQVVPAA